MLCCFCGKDISALRALRDADFCSDSHRALHSTRLRKALLSTLSPPEAEPCQPAGFLVSLLPAQIERTPARCGYQSVEVAAPEVVPASPAAVFPVLAGVGLGMAAFWSETLPRPAGRRTAPRGAQHNLALSRHVQHVNGLAKITLSGSGFEIGKVIAAATAASFERPVRSIIAPPLAPRTTAVSGPLAVPLDVPRTGELEPARPLAAAPAAPPAPDNVDVLIAGWAEWAAATVLPAATLAVAAEDAIDDVPAPCELAAPLTLAPVPATYPSLTAPAAQPGQAAASTCLPAFGLSIPPLAPPSSAQPLLAASATPAGQLKTRKQRRGQTPALPAVPLGLAQPPVPFAADVLPEGLAPLAADPVSGRASTAELAALAPALGLAPATALQPATDLRRLVAPGPATPSVPGQVWEASAVSLELPAAASPVAHAYPAPSAALAALALAPAAAAASASASSSWMSAPLPLAFGTAAGLLEPEFELPAASARVAEDLEEIAKPAPRAPESIPAMAGLVALALPPSTGSPLPSHYAEWTRPQIAAVLPAGSIEAVLEPLELPTQRQEAPAKPVELSRKEAERRAALAAKKAKPRTSASHFGERSNAAMWFRGIAAGMALCAFLWAGSKALRSTPVQTASVPLDSVVEEPVTAARTKPQANAGVLQRVRLAVANRATLQLASDFKNNKAFWDGHAADWGKGWQRNPAGYVNPGQLALYRPSIPLADYRLEFLTQIEKKGVSWAVRAQDNGNYYAMKFSVVEPGLRPIIAVVRYPVVNGKRGRRTEIPLPVMMHNNRAYHVAMEVRGNRFVTSIEGEEVDSWTDDTLAKGGVGFFSEGLERSRLYWMKITNNDDLLGRLCAYLAGPGNRNDGQERAFLNGVSPRGGPRRTIPVAAARIDRRRMSGTPVLDWQVSLVA